MRQIRSRSLWLLVVAAGLAGTSDAQRPSAEQLPGGILVRADVDALRPLLDRLTEVEGSPLADQARAALSVAETCLVVGLVDSAGVTSGWRCADGWEAMSRLLESAGDGDLAFATQVLPQGRWIGSGELDDGGTFRAQAWSTGPGAWWSPSRSGPGRAVFRSSDSVFHARGRVSGTPGPEVRNSLGLLPGLSGPLTLWMSRAVFDGTWELALYSAPPGAQMAPMAVALGLRSHRAGLDARDGLLQALNDAWGLDFEQFSIETSATGLQAHCSTDLSLMPDLAPCVAVVEEVLVLGWNLESMEKSLGAGPRPQRRGHWARLDGHLLAVTDETIATSRGRSPPPALPFTSVEVQGAWHDSRLRLTLEARP